MLLRNLWEFCDREELLVILRNIARLYKLPDSDDAWIRFLALEMLSESGDESAETETVYGELKDDPDKRIQSLAEQTLRRLSV